VNQLNSTPKPDDQAADSLEETLKGLLKFDTLYAAEQTLVEIHAHFSRFKDQGNPGGMERCREIILKGKTRALMIAKNKRVQAKKRHEKAEIGQWFTVWLQTPEIFMDWLALRKRSREFQDQFGSGEGEHSP
jgi:hypothetical protein